MLDAAGFEQELRRCVDSHKGWELGKMLSIGAGGCLVPVAVRAGYGTGSAKQVLLGVWKETARAHLELCRELVGGEELGERGPAMVQLQLAVLRTLNREAEAELNWVLPALFRCTNDMFVVLRPCRAGGDRELLEQIAEVLNKLFKLCLNDRDPDTANSKTWGVYFFALLLFKVYLWLGKYELAVLVEKATELLKATLPEIGSVMAQHRVQYWFYLGLVANYKGDAERGGRLLGQALRECRVSMRTHEERILEHLVPLRFLEAHVVPSEAMYAQFPRVAAVWREIMELVVSGDAVGFDAAVSGRRQWLLEKHMYVHVERLREWCLWSACRESVRVLCGLLLQPEPAIVKLEVFRVALEARSAQEWLAAAVECFVANGIYKGRIKGYLSHTKGVVVLLRQQAFPRASGRSGRSG